jgi:hypothetical protein
VILVCKRGDFGGIRKKVVGIWDTGNLKASGLLENNLSPFLCFFFLQKISCAKLEEFSKMAQAYMYLFARKTALGSTLLAVILAALWAGLKVRNTGLGDLLSFRRRPDDICEVGSYTTEIVSTDPLVIYINNFVSEKEAEALVTAGYVTVLLSGVVIYALGIKISFQQGRFYHSPTGAKTSYQLSFVHTPSPYPANLLLIVPPVSHPLL